MKNPGTLSQGRPDKHLPDMEKTEDKHTEEIKAEAEKSHLWSSMFTEGETENGESRNLRELARSINIDSRWVFAQIPLLLLILLGILFMVTNRYQAQQEIIEKELLKNEVEDWRFRSLTRSSQLTRSTRQSQIELRLRSLGDSTLAPAQEPPFTIIINE